MPLASLASKLKRMDVGERLVRRNPVYYSSIQREFAQLEHASADVLQAWMQNRLLRVLQAAAHTSYGKSVGPRLFAEWPLLRKEQVRDRPDSFVRPSAWGMFNARAATGGTTGVPLKLIRSPECVVAEQVCQDAALASAGVDPLTAKTAVLRGDDIKNPSDLQPPFWISALGGRRLILSSNHLSVHTLAAYVDALNEFKPDLLWVYPTTLESLCLLLQRSGIALRVPVVMSSSEMLAPEVWTLAQQYLGCKLLDRYGQAERLACAHAHSANEYRFVPGYAHVELIADSTQGSTTLYEIVGTSLWNTAMPLVRYRTGDLVRLPTHYGSQEIAEVVRGQRSFEGVIGRINDVLIDATGTQILTGANQIPRGVQHLLRLQVVQEVPGLVVLRALPAAGFSENDQQHLLRNARLKIPTPTEIRVEIATELQRTDRGKTPFVIHGAKVKAALRDMGLRTIAA